MLQYSHHNLKHPILDSTTNRIILEPALAVAGCPLGIIKAPRYELQDGKVIRFSADNSNSFKLTSRFSDIGVASAAKWRSMDSSLSVDSEGTLHIKGGILIPRLSNMHVHSGDNLDAGSGYLQELEQVVGANSTKQRVHAEDGSNIKDSIQAYLADAINNGTGIVFDFREQGTQGVDWLKHASTNLPIGVVALGRPNSDLSDLDDVLDRANGIGVADVLQYSRDKLTEIAETVHKRRGIIAAHAAENKDAYQSVLQQLGETDIEIAIADLSPDLLIHLTQATDSEWELIQKSGVTPVFCLSSNSFFSDGALPIELLRRLETINHFGIGTDNAFNSPSNLFKEIEFFLRLANVTSTSKPSALDVLEKIWNAAWLGHLNLHIDILEQLSASSRWLDSAINNALLQSDPLKHPISALVIDAPPRLFSETTLLHYLSFRVSALDIQATIV